MIELGDEGNALRPPAEPADVWLSLERHQPLVCRAGALRLGSAHSSPVMKRKPSSSMMTIGRRSKKVSSTSFHEEELRAAAESAKEMEDVVDVTTAASGALKPEAESAFERLEIAVREYCYV